MRFCELLMEKIFNAVFREEKETTCHMTFLRTKRNREKQVKCARCETERDTKLILQALKQCTVCGVRLMFRREREKGVSTACKALGYVAVVALGNRRMRCKKIQSPPLTSDTKESGNMFTDTTNYIRNQVFRIMELEQFLVLITFHIMAAY